MRFLGPWSTDHRRCAAWMFRWVDRLDVVREPTDLQVPAADDNEATTANNRRYSINWIRFRIRSENGFRLSRIFANETGFVFGETPSYNVTVHCYLFTTDYVVCRQKPINLPSKSETGFAVNLNPDSIIEWSPIIILVELSRSRRAAQPGRRIRQHGRNATVTVRPPPPNSLSAVKPVSWVTGSTSWRSTFYQTPSRRRRRRWLFNTPQKHATLSILLCNFCDNSTHTHARRHLIGFVTL